MTSYCTHDLSLYSSHLFLKYPKTIKCGQKAANLQPIFDSNNCWIVRIVFIHFTDPLTVIRTALTGCQSIFYDVHPVFLHLISQRNNIYVQTRARYKPASPTLYKALTPSLEALWLRSAEVTHQQSFGCRLQWRDDRPKGFVHQMTRCCRIVGQDAHEPTSMYMIRSDYAAFSL